MSLKLSIGAVFLMFNQRRIGSRRCGGCQDGDRRKGQKSHGAPGVAGSEVSLRWKRQA